MESLGKNTFSLSVTTTMPNSGSDVIFCGLLDNSFYFKVSEWTKFSFSFDKEITRHLSHSPQNKFLVLNSSKQLEFMPLTEAELKLPEANFNIRLYHNDSKEKTFGRAAMLYVNSDGKKMVVTCCSKDEVRPEEIIPPAKIEEDQHRAVFYLSRNATSGSQYMFESSLHRNRFLAFEADKGMSKLVLREKEDVVDEACKFRLC